MTQIDPSLDMSNDPQRRVNDLSDKLTIINRALINTGNNPVNIGDDASDEWIAANNAYEQNVIYLLGKKNWHFDTAIVPLNRIGDSDFPGYRDVFAKPADCIQLMDVWRIDDEQKLNSWLSSFSHAMAGVWPPDLTYKIIADNIHTVAPKGVKAYYTKFPSGFESWSVGFAHCLQLKIEANLYRSLNEDMNASAAWERLAEDRLQEAISQGEKEEPARVMFKSRLEMVRRVRKFGGFIR